MADVVIESKPFSELLDALRTEGVRADNRDRLRRQLSDVQRAIQRLSGVGEPHAGTNDQAQLVFERMKENLRFAREARQLLEESILISQVFISLHSRSDNAPPGVDDRKAILRARPLQGKIDYGELSHEHIARYPKIRARLAE